MCTCCESPGCKAEIALRGDCLAAASRAAERAEDRIAALESQVAALAGALRKAAARIDCDGYCASHRGARGLPPAPCNCNAGKRRAEWEALTADATHLAQLDAARREMCAASQAIRDGTGPLDTAPAWRRFYAATDALAKLEGR